MNTLPETILRQAQALPEGGVLSPKEFLHLGSRSAVDQAFSRLAKTGKLLRVTRGTYAAPVSSRFGSRAPAPEKVVDALAAQSGEIVVPHGASAANSLGLTQQVPIREVYLTSGRTRKLKLGRLEVLMKHAPYWMLAQGTRLAQPCAPWPGLARRMPTNRWHRYAASFLSPNGRRWHRRVRRCPAGWRRPLAKPHVAEFCFDLSKRHYAARCHIARRTLRCYDCLTYIRISYWRQ